ncbi:MAG: hypothetical protein KDA84_17550 [Planctomycetaceae bacterium]|nr:hypothetical protein [Planctomycetaceae bacterium]
MGMENEIRLLHEQMRILQERDKKLFDFVEFEGVDEDRAKRVSRECEVDFALAKAEVRNTALRLAEELEALGYDSTILLELVDAIKHQYYLSLGVNTLWPKVRVALERITLQQSLRDRSGFLGLIVDFTALAISRKGFEIAPIELSPVPWKMFKALFDAKEDGLSKKELQNAIWGEKPVTSNNLDKQKRTVNDKLERLRVEIAADNHGVWRLATV